MGQKIITLVFYHFGGYTQECAAAVTCQVVNTSELGALWLSWKILQSISSLGFNHQITPQAKSH